MLRGGLFGVWLKEEECVDEMLGVIDGGHTLRAAAALSVKD